MSDAIVISSAELCKILVKGEEENLEEAQQNLPRSVVSRAALVRQSIVSRVTRSMAKPRRSVRLSRKSKGGRTEQS